MNIKVKKLDPGAKLPAYAHSGDAGMDLFALEDVTVAGGEIARLRTGIAVEIPPGYVGLCWDKSGLAANSGIKVLGGVIDSGYRGELILVVANLKNVPHVFEAGHKVMQMLIQKVESLEIVEVLELAESARGTGGFGSTGK